MHSLTIMYYSLFLHLKCMNCYNIRFLYLLFPCILKYLICKISDVLHLFLLESKVPQNFCAKCRRQNGSNMSFLSSLKRKHDGKLSGKKASNLERKKIQTIWTVGVIFMEYCLHLTGLVVFVLEWDKLAVNKLNFCTKELRSVYKCKFKLIFITVKDYKRKKKIPCVP